MTMLRPDYPIETARLNLRPFRESDFQAYLAYRNRPDVLRYLYFDQRPEAEILKAVKDRAEHRQVEKEGDFLALVVELRESGEMIGDLVLRWTSETHQTGEIGYCFHPSSHGHGYATEATAELLRLGFAGLGLRRIVGRLDARNGASARVLERLGMRKEAHFVENEWVKGEWTDEAIYAILDRDWRTLNPSTEEASA